MKTRLNVLELWASLFREGKTVDKKTKIIYENKALRMQSCVNLRDFYYNMLILGSVFSRFQKKFVILTPISRKGYGSYLHFLYVRRLMQNCQRTEVLTDKTKNNYGCTTCAYQHRNPYRTKWR